MENYKNQVNEQCQEKIESLLKTLPEFVQMYVTSVLRTRSRRTIASYLAKYQIFFDFICDKNPDLCDRQPSELSLSDLDCLTVEFVNIFLNYMYDHQADNYTVANSNNTVESYSSALNSLFKFLLKNEKIKENPFANVERRHRRSENPAYLKGDENVTFYKGVLDGVGLTKQQLAFREKHHTAFRDYLICRILGTTGIRVSELVGLDAKDIDGVHKQFKVIRKGGKVQTIYMSDKLCDEVMNYIDNIRPLFDNKCSNISREEKAALFLVAQGTYFGQRLSVKSVEELVKKYAVAQGITDAARFHPHSLRHTMGMTALEKSGNLRLVQQILGHENITTTTLYSRMSEEDIRRYRDIGENG